MAKKTIPQKIERKIKSYVGLLKKDKLPIERVVLFGSYAKGRQSDSSDIDICVVSPKFTDQFDALQYLWLKRRYASDTDIEPIGFSPHDFAEDTSLTREIKRTGVEVKT